jgi:hypothetical protein
MTYHPNAQDAMSVYLIAVAHQYNLSPDAIDQSSRMLVQEGTEAFRIVNPNDRTDDGKLSPAAAVCTYNDANKLWKVEIRRPQGDQGDDVVLVRPEGDDFVVVAENSSLTK